MWCFIWLVLTPYVTHGVIGPHHGVMRVVAFVCNSVCLKTCTRGKRWGVITEQRKDEFLWWTWMWLRFDAMLSLCEFMCPLLRLANGNSVKYIPWSMLIVWFSFPSVYIIGSWWIHVDYLPTSFRVGSLALGQSYDCPSASEATLKDMGIIGMYETTAKQNTKSVYNYWDVLCIIAWASIH